MILKNGIYNSRENIELRTALLDAERLKKPITFYTKDRRQITRFTCIDTPNKPITLHNFTISGGLVYYKKNSFEWCTISQDDITQIEIH